MYRHVPAEMLGAAVLQELQKRYDIRDVDYIICGNSVGAGGNAARLAALEAGMDYRIPALTADAQCCSGLAALSLAYGKIASGQAECIIAGGMESTSTQPRRGHHPNHPAYDGEGKWYKTAQLVPGIWRDDIMIACAEYTARREGVTRRDLDQWVLRSRHLACQAADEQALAPFTASVFGSVRDEGVRPISQKLLDRVKPVLPDGQVVTAANAGRMGDGAAMIVLCSAGWAESRGWRKLARIHSMCSCGVEPRLSPLGAVEAVRRVLDRSRMTAADIDVFEIGEAFAVIDELFCRAYPDSLPALNVFGGALAYGHPYGATGAVLALHLLAGLLRKEGTWGCCAAAGAGGLGCALVMERMEQR